MKCMVKGTSGLKSAVLLLDCGAERYVLSGDCVPWPPLILQSRTHTE